MLNTRRGFLSSLLSACTALIVRPTMALAKIPRPVPGIRELTWAHGSTKLFRGVSFTFGQICGIVRVGVYVDSNPMPSAEVTLASWQARRNRFSIPIPPTIGKTFRLRIDAVNKTPFRIYSIGFDLECTDEAKPPTPTSWSIREIA